MSLDDGLAEAHATLANYLVNDYKFVEAEKEFRRAIALSPSYSLAHHWYGIYLLEAGRVEEALEETKRAEELDLLSPVLALNMVAIYAFLGDEVGAEKKLQKLRALDSTEQFLHSTMAWVAEQKGDYEGTVAHMERALTKNSGNAQYISTLGFYFGRLGRRDRAVEMLRVLEGLPEGTFGKPFHLAMVKAGLGERDEMFTLLGRAFDEHSLLFRALRFSRFGPDVRNDPRYVALFQRAGLVP